MLIQAELDVDITLESELCVFNEKWNRQFKHSQALIKEYRPDIVIYPETFYNPETVDVLVDLTEYSKLIIAGSTYKHKENLTVIFNDNKYIYEVKKNNPSPLEVASRYMPYQSFDSLYEEGLWERKKHIFKVKGKDIIVLNCMEYFNSAYLISRSQKYNKNLFGIFCPCSSSNIDLFEQETIVIHNHKENIYTFLCNRISPNPKSTTKGQSYIYGIASRQEKKFLEQEYPNNCNIEHICGITKLGNTPQWIYGEYAINTELSPFGRSDNFKRTPNNFIIGDLVY